VDFGLILPPRSVEDVLAERIRLSIGGEVYDLPVLTIAENRVWLERVDLELGLLLTRISMSGDTDEMLALFDGSTAIFLDFLRSYDTTGVLPSTEVIEASLSEVGLVRMVLEVWRAARPLADIATIGATMDVQAMNGSPPPTTSWLRSMAGRIGRSIAH
jgi:hypothetical protein